MLVGQKPRAAEPITSPTGTCEQDFKDQRPRDPKPSLLTQLMHRLELFWLFTESNFSTFVLTNTAFGILGALSGSRLTTDEHVSIRSVFERIPVVVLFNWSNVFIFDLANQRLPESVSKP